MSLRDLASSSLCPGSSAANPLAQLADSVLPSTARPEHARAPTVHAPQLTDAARLLTQQHQPTDQRNTHATPVPLPPAPAPVAGDPTDVFERNFHAPSAARVGPAPPPNMPHSHVAPSYHQHRAPLAGNSNVLERSLPHVPPAARVGPAPPPNMPHSHAAPSYYRHHPPLAGQTSNLLEPNLSHTPAAGVGPAPPPNMPYSHAAPSYYRHHASSWRHNLSASFSNFSLRAHPQYQRHPLQSYNQLYNGTAPADAIRSQASSSETAADVKAQGKKQKQTEENESNTVV